MCEEESEKPKENSGLNQSGGSASEERRRNTRQICQSVEMLSKQRKRTICFLRSTLELQLDQPFSTSQAIISGHLKSANPWQPCRAWPDPRLASRAT
jgi:hypothetical protein